MRGRPLQGHPEFARAAIALRAAGHLVVSPAEHELALGGNPGDPDPEGRCRAQILRRDMELLLACDGIILMPGWEQSEGARFEACVALHTGMHARLLTAVPERVDPDIIAAGVEVAQAGIELELVDLRERINLAALAGRCT